MALATKGREGQATGEPVDFLIDHADTDSPWAEWIGSELVDAGYRVWVPAWNVRPGQNRLTEQNLALARCSHVLGVLSSAYRVAQDAVRTAAQQQSADGKERAFIPVRVDDADVDPLLGPVAMIDLAGLDETSARRRLLAGAAVEAPRPARAAFPAGSPARGTVRFPAEQPSVWQLGGRRPTPDFVGRDDLMRELRQRLQARTPTALVQVLKGLGGVGKTRLAIEYAHRYSRSYDVVWWVRAEQPETLLSDYAALASHLGLPSLDQQDIAVASVREELGRRHGWLVIFDNAEDQAVVEQLLPDRHAGHVLITTRLRQWQSAEAVTVDVLPPAAAIEYLQRRAPTTNAVTAGTLAAALGYLPLAVAQAAAVIADGMPAEEYLLLLQARAPELFAEGRPDDADATVFTTWRVSLDRLANAPAAIALMRLCSFLAPDDIPLDRLEAMPGMPAELTAILADPLSRLSATRALSIYSLADPTAGRLSMHRLVQLVVRSDLAQLEEERSWALHALHALDAAFPADPEQPGQWGSAEFLLPHAVMAAGHAERLGADPADATSLLDRAARYLLARGLLDQAHALAEQASAAASSLGDDHPAILAARLTLGLTHRSLGRIAEARLVHEEVYKALRCSVNTRPSDMLAAGRALIESRYHAGDMTTARELDEAILPVHVQEFGAEDPATITAHAYHATLVRDAGRYRDALAIEEQVLDARRRLLGADHPHTLNALANIAVTLHDLGDYAGARQRQEQVLDARRRLLGADHPDTLTALANLAVTLGDLGDYAGARQRQEQVLDASTRLLGADHPHTLTALSNLAGTLHDLGDYAGARQRQEQVLDARRRLLGADHPDTLTALANIAGTLGDLGDYAGARQRQEQVLDASTRLLGADHPDTLTALSNLAVTLGDLGDYAGARQRQEQVLDASTRLLGADHPDTLTALSNLAGMLHDLGDYAGARQRQEQVLDASTRLLGADHPDTLTALANLAGMLRDLGDYAGARQRQEQVLDARRRLLGADHPDTLNALANLAGTLGDLGDYAGARQRQEQVLDASTRLLGADHPHTLTALANIAGTLRDLGDYAGARQRQEQVLDASTRLLGADHPHTLTALANIAVTLRDLGDYAGARQRQEQVLDASTRLLGADHPHTLTALSNLAGTLHDLGDYAGARQRQEQVLDARRRLLGADHPHTLNALSNLAATVQGLGDYQRARKILAEALTASRTTLGRYHRQTSVIAWNLAQLHMQRGDLAAARAVIVRDLAWLRSTAPQKLSTEQSSIKRSLGGLGRPPVGRRR